jgi:hypothetical protein
MSNDPRLSILLPLFDHRPGFTATVLHSLDAADPLRRALTPGAPEHEAMVERVYRRMDTTGHYHDLEPKDIAAFLAALGDVA